MFLPACQAPEAEPLSPIQQLFEPWEYEGLGPEAIHAFIRYYPYGEIVDPGTEERASFVIFIPRYLSGEYHLQVEQQENLLRVVPIVQMLDHPPSFMEITQVPNVTVYEMKERLWAEMDPSLIYYHRLPTEDDPFAAIFQEDVIWEDDGSRIWLYVINGVYIRDNNQGGVFVITTQFSSDGAEWFGSLFSRSISTLEIIDE